MARKLKTATAVEETFSPINNTTNLEVQQAAAELISAACRRIGMGLDDYLTVIKDGLTANKTTVDKYGDEHIEADYLVRLKAASMGLEVEGYMKRSGVNVQVVNISLEEKELIEAYKRQ